MKWLKARRNNRNGVIVPDGIIGKAVYPSNKRKMSKIRRYLSIVKNVSRIKHL